MNNEQAALSATIMSSPLAHDPHRPSYHFLPPANWLNDPNGVVHWNGQYHLFYQYNPGGAFHDTIHWGHAVSHDLVHWSHLPLALTPTSGGPDADGCWSGCFVDNDGVPTLIYTGMRLEHGVKVQRPCLATGSDDLLTWEKSVANPIIQQSPPDLDVLGFRDHCVWRENGIWYQIIGSGIRGVGGTALLYRSRDLLAWEYVQPILVGDQTEIEPVWTGDIWECPDLFPLEHKHVLVISVWADHQVHYPAYFVGTFAGGTFTPDSLQRLDHGSSFYAPQSMRDLHGRRMMWGWLREGRDLQAQRAAGWSGVMSLPRILTLRPDETLAVAPAPELAGLREAHVAVSATTVVQGSVVDLPVAGDTLELVAELDPQSAESCGLSVRCSPDGSEATHIIYDRAAQRLTVDAGRSSLDSSLYRDVFSAPYSCAAGETLKLHVFVDRSVLEVFAGDSFATAVRIYPTRADSLGVQAFAHGGDAALLSLDTWTLRSIW